VPQQKEEIVSEFEPTSLGMATFQSSFSISESSFVISQIQKSLAEGIIFKDDLHVVYLLTPISNLIEPDWMALFNIFNKLEPTKMKIAKLIGLDESLLVNKAMDRNAQSDTLRELVARRFYNALILTDLVSEMNYFDVSTKYGIESRGSVQNLMISAGQFSSMMVSFCSRLKFTSLELIFRKYSARIGNGVKDELVELMQIENMSRSLARILFEYEYETVKSLATITPKKLFEKVGTALGTRPKATAKMIVANAKRILSRDVNRYRHMSEEMDILL
jgi:replicative superfamily II helicase